MNDPNLTPPIAGFISPPHWFDPSPAEFQSICADPVAIQQNMMPMYNLAYGQLENIAGTVPEMMGSARLLASAGCDVIAHTGTPFGWAGLPNETEARNRQALLADIAGVPVVMAGTAIIDGLRALGVGKVAVATPYYDTEWRDAWAAILNSTELDILLMQSMGQQGLVPSDSNVDDHGWAMTPELIIASAEKIARDAKGAEVVVITGAGARTLTLTHELEERTGMPVLASDTALYWAIARKLGVRLNDNSLGTLTHV